MLSKIKWTELIFEHKSLCLSRDRELTPQDPKICSLQKERNTRKCMFRSSSKGLKGDAMALCLRHSYSTAL